MGHFLDPLLQAPDVPHVLVNERSGSPVATVLEPAFDATSRRRGLLGRTGLAPGAALILAPCWSVHTVGMAFALDIVFVRRDGTVTKVCPGTPPFRARASWGAFAVVELAAHGAGGIRAGDRLKVAPAAT